MNLGELDRRTLLKWLIALSAGASSARVLAREGTSSVLKGMGEADVDAFKDLGRKYEAEYAEDRAGIDLMTDLLSDADFTDEGLIERLRREMHEDYELQQTADLYGWFVSRTEARVLAAIARVVE